VKLFQKTIIGRPADPLLIRYILFRCRWFGIYLHHLMRSDHDRALHDHPWNFISILLTGEYKEHTAQGVTHHRRGSILIRPAMWLHRFELEHPMWTLVFVGSRLRRWGFMTPLGWCWWRTYNYEQNVCEEEVLWTGGND
jgi:hypothetical protein